MKKSLILILLSLVVILDAAPLGRPFTPTSNPNANPNDRNTKALSPASNTIASTSNTSGGEESGFFIGTQTGIGKADYKGDSYGNSAALGGNQVYQNNTISKGDTQSLGVRAGYKHMTDRNHGFRIYGVANYTKGILEGTAKIQEVEMVIVPPGTLAPIIKSNVQDAYAKVETMDYSLNIDALLNLFYIYKMAVGIYAGGGMGYNAYTLSKTSDGLTTKANSVSINANAGLKLNIAHNTDLEIGMVYPFAYLDKATQTQGQVTSPLPIPIVYDTETHHRLHQYKLILAFNYVF